MIAVIDYDAGNLFKDADIIISEHEEREELLQRLQQVIDDNLTKKDKCILKLHYEDEMTYKETGAMLGISVSAVNKHITQSLAKIRENLKIAKRNETR